MPLKVLLGSAAPLSSLRVMNEAQPRRNTDKSLMKLKIKSYFPDGLKPNFLGAGLLEEMEDYSS